MRAPAFIRSQWRVQFGGGDAKQHMEKRVFVRGRKDSLLHKTDLVKEILMDWTFCYFLVNIGTTVVCYCVCCPSK